MKVLAFTDQEIWSILSLLAAILHLGNIKYKSTVVQNMDAVEVNDSTNATRVSGLLGVTKGALVNALTRRTIIAQGERVVSQVSKEQALEARDAFVKAIYGKIFLMVVNKINSAIFKSSPKGRISIGVLDIFGFEQFETNSFEQLCINFANENLQQFFVKHIFKVSQLANVLIISINQGPCDSILTYLSLVEMGLHGCLLQINAFKWGKLLYNCFCTPRRWSKPSTPARASTGPTSSSSTTRTCWT